MHLYVCYCLQSCTTGKTYVGVSNNLERRLRQHNGELTGGAKYTSFGGPWTLAILVGPFPTYQHALHFEWHWKHIPPKKLKGIHGRQVKLLELVSTKVKWPLTFNSLSELHLPTHMKKVDNFEDVIVY
jgi:predicted GIY-YIG superfamily endonuclease